MEHEVEFEWNDAKAKMNLQNHGVSFDEAASTFYDDNARHFQDIGHSDEEERRRLIGMSNKSRVLLVVYTLRDVATIRIISARKATLREQKAYGKED